MEHECYQNQEPHKNFVAVLKTITVVRDHMLYLLCITVNVQYPLSIRAQNRAHGW